MALDPNIILQAGRGVTPLMNPADIQAQRMERELGGYKLAQARQGMEDDAAYRQELQAGGGGADLATRLYKRGLGKQAAEAQKFQTDQQTAQANTRKTQIETTGKITELMGGPLKYLSENPTLEDADAVLTHLVNAKFMSPEQLQSARQQIQADPTPQGIRKFAMLGYQAAISADKQMQADSQRRGQDMTQSTALRGQDLSAQTSRANNEATVGASIRGQDLGDVRARDLNTIRAQELTAQRQATQQQRGTDATDKKVTAFSAQLDKTNIPQFETLLADIEATVAAHQAKNKDIPGYGSLMGNLPTWAQGEEGKELRQKIATLRNLTLKDRSGAAVTNQELSRLLEELGTGFLKTDTDLTRGLAGVRQNLDSVKQNVVAGVDDATLNEYQARGGMTLKRGAPGKPPGGAAPAGGATLRVTNAADYANVPSGATYTTPDGKTRRKP